MAPDRGGNLAQSSESEVVPFQGPLVADDQPIHAAII